MTIVTVLLLVYVAVVCARVVVVGWRFALDRIDDELAERHMVLALFWPLMLPLSLGMLCGILTGKRRNR